MDALFLPLANALGASVDQIKVIYQALCQIHSVGLTFLQPQVNIMSTHCIPSWTSLCESTVLDASAASSVQYHRGHCILLPHSPVVLCILSVAGKHSGHVYCCKLS